NVPAVSYLKAPGYLDGHAGYSSPLAEQTFIVDTLNRLQALPQWREMAVFITYDDSDGWYDHVVPPIVNHSTTVDDAAICTGGSPSLGNREGRCGYGPRLPLLVISPFVRKNHVDHNLSDQSSILKFIEAYRSLGPRGGGSYHTTAGPLLPWFDPDDPHPGRFIPARESGAFVRWDAPDCQLRFPRSRRRTPPAAGILSELTLALLRPCL